VRRAAHVEHVLAPGWAGHEGPVGLLLEDRPPPKTSWLCLFFSLVPAFPPCSRAPASSAPQVDALHALDGAGAVAQAIGRKVPAFTRLAQEGLQEIPEGWQSTIKKGEVVSCVYAQT